MSNDNYILQLEPTSFEPQLQSPSPPSSSQEQSTKEPLSNSAGQNPFSFTVSQSFVDFGILSPTYPVSRSHKLQVAKGSATGYLVFVYQNHPLQDSLGNIIPDTSCNSGSCTSALSEIWTNTLSYGFGYHCNMNLSACLGFFEENAFMRFANESQSESPFTLIKGKNLIQDAQVTYKINVTKTQTKGRYTNIITYIAIPSY